MIPALFLAVLIAAEPAEERADALMREGAALGDKALWDEAIERFRASDREFPRAIVACNIGLAHARAGRPEHALLHLGRCRARATEVLPPWVDRTIDEARAQLARRDYAPVELIGAPGITVTVDTYPEDPLPLPATVWLPFGEHRLAVRAHGFVPADVTVDIRSKAPLRQALSLSPEPTAPEPTAPEPTAPEPTAPEPTAPEPTAPEPTAPEPRDERLPAWVALTVGGGALATGAVFYGLALDSHATAERLEAGPAFDEELASFRERRALAYGFLIGGALVTATGAVLAWVLDDGQLALTPGGAVATLRF